MLGLVLTISYDDERFDEKHYTELSFVPYQIEFVVESTAKQLIGSSIS